MHGLKACVPEFAGAEGTITLARETLAVDQRGPVDAHSGAPAPSAEQWWAVYDDKAHVQDPTQEKPGTEAYIVAQEGLMRRFEDGFLEPGAVALSGETAFVEWTMGLKIKRIEFVNSGTTRLRLGAEGKIEEHRDDFDVVGPTFEPVPVVGGSVAGFTGASCLEFTGGSATTQSATQLHLKVCLLFSTSGLPPSRMGKHCQ